MGIPDHLTCLLRKLYAGLEATFRTGHGTKTGKGVCQGCILSLCLFNLYAEYIIRNAGLGDSQAGIKIAGLRFFTVWRVVPPTPDCSESTICSSLALSTLTLYNHHYHPSPEFFIFANWIFVLIKCWPSIPLYPQPLVTVSNLLCPMILPFPGDSYK